MPTSSHASAQETNSANSHWSDTAEEMWLRNLPRFIRGMQFYTPQLIRKADIHSTDRILEIGCGSGDLATLLAPLTHSITAIDKIFPSH